MRPCETHLTCVSGVHASARSQYSHEEETLFPPLTGMEVLGTRIENNLLVVETRVSVNLVGLTIEEVPTRTRTRARTHACAHARTHARRHTRTHTRTHALIHINPASFHLVTSRPGQPRRL